MTVRSASDFSAELDGLDHFFGEYQTIAKKFDTKLSHGANADNFFQSLGAPATFGTIYVRPLPAALLQM
jgi:hypothetical protein